MSLYLPTVVSQLVTLQHLLVDLIDLVDEPPIRFTGDRTKIVPS